MSFPATVKYVTFMKVESTSYLKIRFDYLYSIYVVFIVAAIARYVWLMWQLLRKKETHELEAASPSSGL
jgi:C4-dicarboxylate transporter DctQ subunit